METLEEITQRIEAAVPGAQLEIIPNPGPAAQHSLLIDHDHAVAIATFLRDDVALKLDYCSNVTGIDWPDIADISLVGSAAAADDPSPVGRGSARAAADDPSLVGRGFACGGLDDSAARAAADDPSPTPPTGYLETVYHLYSISHRHGPVILRLRTRDRREGVSLPSLTPVYRAAEFQEREIFDLYGIHFTGHPDQRRILMWEEFEDHPMRKDYVNPDDYEYEPTPHDSIVARAAANLDNRRGADGCESFGQPNQQS